MKSHDFLLLFPLFISLIFVATFFIVDQFRHPGSSILQTFLLHSTPSAGNDDTCACNISANGRDLDYCYNATSPVLGGVDVVQFFTAFQLSDGSYNESEVGQQGLAKHSSNYNSYTYHFVSKSNLR